MSKINAFADAVVKKYANVVITERLEGRVEGSMFFESPALVLAWWAVEKNGFIHVCSEETENSTIVRSLVDFGTWSTTVRYDMERARLPHPIEAITGRAAPTETAEDNAATTHTVYSPTCELGLKTLEKACKALRADVRAALKWRFVEPDVNPLGTRVMCKGTVLFLKHFGQIEFEVMLLAEGKELRIAIAPQASIDSAPFRAVKGVLQANDAAYAAYDLVWPGQQDHLVIWCDQESITGQYYHTHSGTSLSEDAVLCHGIIQGSDYMTPQQNEAFERVSAFLCNYSGKREQDKPVRGNFKLITNLGYV